MLERHTPVAQVYVLVGGASERQRLADKRTIMMLDGTGFGAGDKNITYGGLQPGTVTGRRRVMTARENAEFAITFRVNGNGGPAPSSSSPPRQSRQRRQQQAQAGLVRKSSYGYEGKGVCNQSPASGRGRSLWQKMAPKRNK